MNALEMASVIEADCPFDLSEAAALLRRQYSDLAIAHEAIVKLRENLQSMVFGMNGMPCECKLPLAIEAAEQALKDTEEIAK